MYNKENKDKNLKKIKLKQKAMYVPESAEQFIR